jgi:hypothetical protein
MAGKDLQRGIADPRHVGLFANRKPRRPHIHDITLRQCK